MTAEEALLERLKDRAARVVQDRQESQADSTARLVERLRGRVAPGVLDLLETNPTPTAEEVSAAVAVPDWRTTGHDNFMDQLRRIDEANRVLRLAWDSDMFDDCFPAQDTYDALGQRAYSTEKLQAARTLVEQRAYEILAEQYPDLKVMVRPPRKAYGGRPGGCWMKVLAKGDAP